MENLPTLEQFEALVRSRRAVRHFRPDPLPEGVLERLLDAARWAPSGYNLQPARFVVVEDPALKPALRVACMDQAQVAEAPVTVVFCGDRRAYPETVEEILAQDRAAGAINAEYEAKLRKIFPLAFQRGPVGVNFLWKALLPPLVRILKPMPEIPAVFPVRWVNRQVMLGAMSFMLAARAAGLATVPMEGFDPKRVAQVVGLPRWVHPVLVVPVGFDAAPEGRVKTRLPLAKLAHRNRWGGGWE